MDRHAADMARADLRQLRNLLVILGVSGGSEQGRQAYLSREADLLAAAGITPTPEEAETTEEQLTNLQSRLQRRRKARHDQNPNPH